MKERRKRDQDVMVFEAIWKDHDFLRNNISINHSEYIKQKGFFECPPRFQSRNE
jgi:hypothetical protein